MPLLAPGGDAKAAFGRQCRPDTRSTANHVLAALRWRRAQLRRRDSRLSTLTTRAERRRTGPHRAATAPVIGQELGIIAQAWRLIELTR